MPSGTYTHGHHASVLASHGARTAHNSAAYLLPHLRPGSRLLDVGCGPGTITLDLAEIVGPGRVIGVENVEPPLTAARRAARERGDTQTRFALADAYRLPYADGAFDVVHAHQVLQHLTDPVAALREMARVCRPGGLVAARDVDYAAMTWYPSSEGVSRWLATYRALARANGGEPDAGRRLKAWAHRAGLREVTASASVWCYATPEETAWWAGTWSQRITESSFAEQARDRGLADAAALEAMSRAWRSWASQPDAWFAALHGEILAVVP